MRRLLWKIAGSAALAAALWAPAARADGGGGGGNFDGREVRRNTRLEAYGRPGQPGSVYAGVAGYSASTSSAFVSAGGELRASYPGARGEGALLPSDAQPSPGGTPTP